MIRKGNVTIGLQTRFGPDWTGIRCGARTKLGGECQRPAVKKTGRCTRHGGKSTGPRTQAGRNKIAALHTTHGKHTKTKRQEAQKSAEVVLSLISIFKGSPVPSSVRNECTSLISRTPASFTLSRLLFIVGL